MGLAQYIGVLDKLSISNFSFQSFSLYGQHAYASQKHATQSC